MDSKLNSCKYAYSLLFVQYFSNILLNCNRIEIGLYQWCSNFSAPGPHLSFRNPSLATRINNLNKNYLKNSLKWLSDKFSFQWKLLRRPLQRALRATVWVPLVYIITICLISWFINRCNLSNFEAIWSATFIYTSIK